MHDIHDLRRKALAAREVQVVVGAATFTLRLPTHAMPESQSYALSTEEEINEGSLLQ